MPAKNNLRIENTKTFFNSFATDDYYLFFSTYNPETLPDSRNTVNSIFENVTFGLKVNGNGSFVTSKDVRYLIQNRTYQPNIVYDMYDDQVNMFNLNYYVLVDISTTNTETGQQTTSEYQVFKCLFNNNGAESTQTPIYVSGSPLNRELSDGYIWRFMYTITDFDYKRYSVQSYAPIYSSSVPTTDGIDIILVENLQDNTGYQVIKGSLTKYFPTSEGIGFSIDYNNSILNDTQNNLSSIQYFINDPDDFVLYVTSGNTSDLYDIVSYDINNNTFTVNNTSGITQNFASFIQTNSEGTITNNVTFEILPKIVVTGDGSGCRAIPRIGSNTKAIETILVLTPGSGYTSSRASVQYTSSEITDAILRPIIPPRGGHGSDLVSDLTSTEVIIYGEVSSKVNNIIPSSGSYTMLSLVKNPSFTSSPLPTLFDNRLKITLQAPNPFEINDVVVMQDGTDIAAQGIVDEVVGNDIYIRSYVERYFKGNRGSSFQYLFTDRQVTLINNLNGNLIGDKSATIDSVTDSIYEQKTGTVLHYNLFDAITRDNEKTETFRLIVDF